MPTPQQVKGAWRKRFIPFGIILTVLALVFITGLDQHLTMDTLAYHRAELLRLVEERAVLMGVSYLVLQTAISAFSIPAVAPVIVAGGFLFGPVVGTAISIVGQTIGSAIIFIAARTALRDMLAHYAGRRIRRFEAGFKENALSYMITLRLMPLFPAWLINLVPSILGVPLRIFMLGTIIGVIPITFIFSTVGHGLGAVIDEGDTPGLGLFLAPEIAFPLIGLVIIALLPVLYRKLRPQKPDSDI